MLNSAATHKTRSKHTLQNIAAMQFDYQQARIAKVTTQEHQRCNSIFFGRHETQNQKMTIIKYYSKNHMRITMSKYGKELQETNADQGVGEQIIHIDGLRAMPTTNGPCNRTIVRCQSHSHPLPGAHRKSAAPAAAAVGQPGGPNCHSATITLSPGCSAWLHSCSSSCSITQKPFLSLWT